MKSTRGSPTDVDMLWHVHMSMPTRYAAFCEGNFGQNVLINYTPRENMEKESKETEAAWKKLFPTDTYAYDMSWLGPDYESDHGACDCG